MGEHDRESQVQYAEPLGQSDLLDFIIQEGRLARNDDHKEHARELVVELAQQVLAGEVVVSTNTEQMIHTRIAQIDKLISDQLNEVIHHPEFQKLEASWRGLSYLVNETETAANLKLRVLNVSKHDLLKDMEKAAEFDQSSLFKKIYEEEFGSYGGASYGCLLGDFEFDNNPRDLSLLSKMSQVAAAAHAPVITCASAGLFNLENFTDLDVPRDLTKIFQGAEYAKWRSFRESEDSRYVSLCLPHVLMRLPYGRDNDPVESFAFEEDVDGTDNGKYLWGNAAYCLASRITDAFANYGWTAAIRGVEGGGMVNGLPSHTFGTDGGRDGTQMPY